VWKIVATAYGVLTTCAQLPARIRFHSIEPLLEHLGPFARTGIDWGIVGGESGAGCRPIENA
jgi:protein gp37